MPSAELEIKGLAELRRKFERMPEILGKGMRTTMKGAVEMLRAEIAKYPPTSGANVPPGLNGYSWYERGYGTRTIKGKGYPTSEKLGASWATSIKGTGLNLTGTVGTKVSYARYVQDEEMQASFHTRRGWRTVQQVLKEKTPDIVRFVTRTVDKLLQRIANR